MYHSTFLDSCDVNIVLFEWFDVMCPALGDSLRNTHFHSITFQALKSVRFCTSRFAYSHNRSVCGYVVGSTGSERPSLKLSHLVVYSPRSMSFLLEFLQEAKFNKANH